VRTSFCLVVLASANRCSPPEVLRDKRIQPDTELSDSEDEGAGGRRNRKDRKLLHPNPGQDAVSTSRNAMPPGSEVPTPPRAGRDGQEVATENGEGARGDGTPVASTEPMSPTAAAPGLSMNAFGRPKMTAAAVGADDDMDIDDPILPGGAPPAEE
jgi:histone deacetylase 1/2